MTTNLTSFNSYLLYESFLITRPKRRNDTPRGNDTQKMARFTLLTTSSHDCKRSQSMKEVYNPEKHEQAGSEKTVKQKEKKKRNREGEYFFFSPSSYMCCSFLYLFIIFFPGLDRVSKHKLLFIYSQLFFSQRSQE